MTFDEELAVIALEKAFKNDLNTEIDKVNTEKGSIIGDVLFLENIPNDKFIFESLDSRILNYEGFFVFYGFVDTEPKSAQVDNYIDDVVMGISIGTFDNGEEDRSNTLYKLLRYRKALKQVVFKNPDMFSGYAKPLVSSLKPSAFPFDNKTVILSIGLEITASITAN